MARAKGNRGEPLPAPHDGLPDSSTGGGLCPRCHKQSSFEHIDSVPVTFDGGHALRDGNHERTFADQVSVLECRHCRQRLLVVEEECIDGVPRRLAQGGGTITYRGHHWWPLPGSSPSPDVPDLIASAYSEAERALAAGCPRASAVMARRAVEALTVDKGVPKGRLVDRLKTLADDGTLQPTLADWAKEIRLVGNDGAHSFDPLDEVSLEDARALLTFLEELLNYVYVMPAELARRRGAP